MWLCNQWWVWLWSLKLFWKSWSLCSGSEGDDQEETLESLGE